MSTLKPGMRVKIYHDPITRGNLEGEAVLKKLVRTFSDGCEQWMVKFDGDRQLYERAILAGDEVAP